MVENGKECMEDIKNALELMKNEGRITGYTTKLTKSGNLQVVVVFR